MKTIPDMKQQIITALNKVPQTDHPKVLACILTLQQQPKGMSGAEFVKSFEQYSFSQEELDELERIYL